MIKIKMENKVSNLIINDVELECNTIFYNLSFVLIILIHTLCAYSLAVHLKRV